MEEDVGNGEIVRKLRNSGFHVLTTQEAGKERQPDDEQLAFAIEQGRAIYTFNVGDFARLHADYMRAGLSHNGVLTVPRQSPALRIGQQIHILARLLAERSVEALRDQILYL